MYSTSTTFFSIIYMYGEKQNQSFKPIFLNRYLSNEKNIFADNSRAEPTILSVENIVSLETFLWPFLWTIFH